MLTTEQWLGVADFARAVDGQIVTSFPASEGTRNADGSWRTDQARSLLRFSAENDVPLVAVELFNEPTLPVSMPVDYDAEGFARDLAALLPVVEEEFPDLLLVGPGPTAEETPLVIEPGFTSDEILDETGPAFDVFAFHFYPKVSERCGSPEGDEIALTDDYLGRVDVAAEHYRAVHDEHLPDTPTWIGETAQAACGGDRWAATARDVPRYVDTLGRLADGDGDVVFHNTLAASDYGLLDEDGFETRPNYWAALLWARLMGPRVLTVAEQPTADGLSVYAHCSAGDQAGVTYAVVNTSETDAAEVAVDGAAEAFVLHADDLDGTTIDLNGEELTAAEDGTVPDLAGAPVEGSVEVPPASVAFVVAEEGPAVCE